jgi:hypothetical protein
MKPGADLSCQLERRLRHYKQENGTTMKLVCFESGNVAGHILQRTWSSIGEQS